MLRWPKVYVAVAQSLCCDGPKFMLRWPNTDTGSVYVTVTKYFKLPHSRSYGENISMTKVEANIASDLLVLPTAVHTVYF